MSDTFDSDDFTDYQPPKRGRTMEITVEMASKTSREYGGRVKWGVHPKGAPKDYWVDIYVQDRPKPGQVFNLGAIKETQSADGAKIFREAEIIGPAMAPQQNGQSYRMVGNLKNAPKEDAPLPKTIENGVQMFKPNDKIKFSDWGEVAGTIWKHGIDTGMPPEQCIGYVQTTLVALRDGKLELPTEAGPVVSEPGDDGDAYANPDAVTPWGN